jgi:hypothetical protein
MKKLTLVDNLNTGQLKYTAPSFSFINPQKELGVFYGVGKGQTKVKLLPR